MALFAKDKYTLIKVKRKNIPDGIWAKCPGCGSPVYRQELAANLNVCPKCQYHLTLTAQERVDAMVDDKSFVEMDANLVSADPINFKGLKTYKEKLQSDQKATGLKDAILTGTGTMNGKKIALAVTDSRFIMGSMGAVLGERLTRLVEHATAKRLPVIIVSGSGGGARMYEGTFALMQMAKTCAALKKHSDAGCLHISLLTNPTMGGVMASFAGIGDVIIAEPKALLGFTGPRVIEQTIRQKLPEGFQSSEFLLAHGLIDMIVHRKNMKDTLTGVLDYTSAASSA